MKIVKPPKVNTPGLPSMPIPPETLSGVMPKLIPPIQYENSIVGNFFHNWKVGQMEREAERRAKIAINNEQETSARLRMMTEIITWQAKTQDVFNQYAHIQSMREREIQLTDAKVTEATMKNQLLWYECEKAKFEHEQLLKEVGNGETIDV